MSAKFRISVCSVSVSRVNGACAGIVGSIQHLLHGEVLRQNKILIQESHANVLAKNRFTTIGNFDTAQNFKQGCFAASIAGHKGYLFTGTNPKADVGKQCFSSERFRKIID